MNGDQDGIGSLFHSAAEREEARLQTLANSVMGLNISGVPSLEDGILPPMIKLTRPYDKLLDPTVLENCKTALSEVALWLDHYSRLLRGANIMRFITELFANATGVDLQVVTKLRLVTANLFEILMARKPAFDVYAQNIREEIAYITPDVKSQEYVDFVNRTRKDPKMEDYKWYVNTVPGMEALLDLQ